MSQDWEIRDSVAVQTKLDELFSAVTKIAENLGVDIELQKKYYKNADDFRWQRGSHKLEEGKEQQ